MDAGGEAPGFLGKLSQSELAELRGIARGQRFSRGALLLAERQVGDRVMVLLSGRVKVTAPTPDGREAILGFRGPGDLVGELAAIDERPRSGNVEAIDPVEVLTLPAPEFRAFIARHPAVALHVMRLLSERLRDADRKRIEFAAADTVGRVAARLLELVERFGEPEGEAIAIMLPLTQEELAAWCASSREATVKALQTLRGLGWIDTARRRITIHDLQALRARSA